MKYKEHKFYSLKTLGRIKYIHFRKIIDKPFNCHFITEIKLPEYRTMIGVITPKRESYLNIVLR